MSVADRQRSSKRSAIAAAAVAAVLGVSASSPLWADNWPGFRGAGGQSASSEKNLPVEFGPDQNLKWRVELPGPNNASPVVWGDRVFLNQADSGNRRTVMCFSRADGKLLWQSGITYPEPETTHPQNPPCSGTPVTDGERVIASFGSAGLYCYDFDGHELWHRDLGKLNHMFGNAISPVLAGELVILNFGPGEGTKLVAVNKKTGEVAWEQAPPKVDPNEMTMGGPRLMGPGMMVAPQMIGQGDKDDDGALSRDEMAALAVAWYEKLDPEKTSKVTQEQFIERLGEVIPSPMGPPPGGPRRGGPGGPPPGGDGARPEAAPPPPPGSRPGGPGGPDGPRGGGGFNPGRILGPAIFGAADADRDGTLAPDEWKTTFDQWFTKWSGGKGDAVDTNQVLDGINAILPPPQLGPGGPGGPGGRPGGRRGGGPGGFGGNPATGPAGSWSTPIVIDGDGRQELIVAFPHRLAAYDPQTGKPLWFSKGLADAVHPTPIHADGVVVATASSLGGGTILAVKPGGEGDVTESHRVWHQPRVKGSIGTGVVHDGRLFSITSDGFALCLDMKTGERVWQKRLEGGGANGQSWSSMLLADGRIYVPNQSGDIFVLRAGPKFELLAANAVEEPTNSTLAASDGELFMRTDNTLWCFGNAK
jgi:outer membrane protein assembly factor BamB